MAHPAHAGYKFQKPKVTSTDNPATASDPDPRPRFTRDPDRPTIQLKWCKAPRGSPGRSGFDLPGLLCMGQGGYTLVRTRMKEIMIHDPEINMNKSITHNDDEAIRRVCYQALAEFPEFDIFRRQKLWPLKAFVHLILKATSEKHNSIRRQLEDEEAAVRGEVIVRKKKAKAPDTARARAKVKQLKSAKQAQKLDPSNDSSTPTRSNMLPEGQVELPSEVSGAGNQQTTRDNDRANTNINADPDAMDVSFVATRPKTPVDTHEDELQDLTHDLASMSMDPLEDDEAEGGTENILGPINPLASSTPLPTRVTQQPSSLSTASHAPSATADPALVVSSKSKAKRPRPKFVDPAVLANSVPDGATPAILAAAPSPPITSAPLLAPSSTQSLAQGAAIPPANLTSPSPAELAAQVTKLQLLAASLGDAQRAAMPLELWESLSAFTTLTSGSVLAQPPAPKSGIDNPPFDGDSDLSDPESASESNRPIANQGPTAQSQARNNSNAQKNAKNAAKAKAVLPGVDEAVAESVGAKTARAIRAAKGGKGKTVAVTADNEDQVVSVKEPTRKSSRNTTKAQQGNRKK
ncbi:unnamed protein product [Rhizoctonia solani]|uniref:Uncharacterized protein n=1 Tax=Rhizoctonia solani TaxID=456999 RepID=A0A8H3H6Q3_9AGAM|nr:unnamed protein product [Rhizoctonia solani]